MGRQMDSSERVHPAGRVLPVSGVADLLLGDWRMLTDPLEGARRQYARHGEVVNARWAGLNIVNLYGPNANELVLHSRDDLFSSKQAWDFYIGRIFPNGLMLRDGDDHPVPEIDDARPRMARVRRCRCGHRPAPAQSRL